MLHPCCCMVISEFANTMNEQLVTDETERSFLDV